MVLLHEYPASPYARKVKIALAGQGIAFDHRLEWMLRSGGAEIVLEGVRRGNVRFSAEPA